MARSRKKEDSVYDFLYIDTKRIGILLSQFGTDGILTELSRSTDTTSETGGKIDLKILGINQKEGDKTGLIRKCDPQWLIPLLFLREAKDVIVRDISKARIGQFVIMSGSLSISDLSILRMLWDVPFVQQSIAAGHTPSSGSIVEASRQREPSRRERQGSRRQSVTPGNSALDEIRNILDVIKVMPHGIFASLEKDDTKVWGALHEEGMLVSSADLMLNHGSTISGEWNVVGILDGIPDNEDANKLEQLQTINALSPPNPFKSVLIILQAFAPLTRQLLGRPADSFGVTPLLIFREIGA